MTARAEKQNKKLPSLTTGVFQGGWTDNWVEIGSIMALDDSCLLSNINNIIGTSMGGMIGTMLALGKDLNYIFEFMSYVSPQELHKKQDSLIYNKISGSKENYQKLSAHKKFKSGDGLYEYCQLLVFEQLGTPDATFTDLEKSIKNLNKDEKNKSFKFRNLSLTGTVKNDSRNSGSYQVVFDHKSTPNMPIAVALRITCALSLMFPPIEISKIELKTYQKDSTANLVRYDRGGNYKKTKDVKFDNVLIIDDGGLPGPSASLPLYLCKGKVEQVLAFSLLTEKDYVAIKTLQEKAILLHNKKISNQEFEKAKFEFSKTQTEKSTLIKVYAELGLVCPPPDLLTKYIEQIIPAKAMGVTPKDINIEYKRNALLLREGYNKTLEVLHFKEIEAELDELEPGSNKLNNIKHNADTITRIHVGNEYAKTVENFIKKLTSANSKLAQEKQINVDDIIQVQAKPPVLFFNNHATELFHTLIKNCISNTKEQLDRDKLSKLKLFYMELKAYVTGITWIETRVSGEYDNLLRQSENLEEILVKNEKALNDWNVHVKNKLKNCVKYYNELENAIFMINTHKQLYYSVSDVQREEIKKQKINEPIDTNFKSISTYSKKISALKQKLSQEFQVVDNFIYRSSIGSKRLRELLKQEMPNF